MREYIQRERRVELFYEGKRPWTCRLYLEPYLIGFIVFINSFLCKKVCKTNEYN